MEHEKWHKVRQGVKIFGDGVLNMRNTLNRHAMRGPRVHSRKVQRQAIVIQHRCYPCTTRTVKQPLRVVLELGEIGHATFEIWTVLHSLGDQNRWKKEQLPVVEIRSENVFYE